MNFGRSFICKIIIFCSLLYLFSVIIILSFINNKKCDSFESIESSPQLMNEMKTKNLITIIIIEFELFEHDLISTLESICKLQLIDSILIVSEKIIYPPIYGSIDTLLSKCNIQLITTGPHVQKMLNESRVETFINTPYVLVIPDSIRIHSQNIIYHFINSIKELNQRSALIVSIASNHSIDSNLKKSINNCIQIDFDIKRWTLRYTISDSSDSCDAFEGDEFAVLIRKTDFLQLNRPFVRPFMESFFIQSKIHKIQLQLLKNIVLDRGQQLYTSNERNKWKHNMWSEERRRRLYDMFGIKKMIDSKGGVHWFGCTKSTNRCFATVVNDMPDYLYANRWTPVCCLENLAKTGRHVFSTLEKLGVRYWLEGGSLLGAARNALIIPWDYDIDIGIYKEDIKKCHLFSQNTPIIDEKGFVWEKAKEGDFFRVQFSSTNHLHVDIFPFYSRNGTMTKDTWFESHIQDREFPEHFLKPLTKIRFIEWDAFAPNNIVEFLELKFGKNVINDPQYPKPHLLKFSN